MLYFLLIFISLIPILVLLIMSKTREQSTLAIVLACFVSSLGALTIPTELLGNFLFKFILGFTIGSVGIIYREMVIWRESREGLMCKKERSKISSFRFISSLTIRIMQVIPLGVWTYLLFPLLILAVVIGYFFLAFALSVNEHYRLWK